MANKNDKPISSGEAKEIAGKLSQDLELSVDSANDLANALGEVHKKHLANLKIAKRFREDMAGLLENSKDKKKVEQEIIKTLSEQKDKQISNLKTAMEMNGIRDEGGKIEKEYTKEIEKQHKMMTHGILPSTMGFVDGLKGSVAQMLAGSRAMKAIQTVMKALSSPGMALGALAGGGLMLALKALAAAIEFVKDAFMAEYNFLQDKVMPTHAQANIMFGNTGKALSGLKSHAISTGVQFENLGYSFEQGATAVLEFNKHINAVGVNKGLTKFGLMMSEYVGAGAENAGRLTTAFKFAGLSLDDMNDTMKNASKVASEYGVPVNAIRKDMAENIDILQRYGVNARLQFMRASALARSYNLNIKDINATYGKSMDTFDKTTDVAAKFNTIFGTSLNSYELLLAKKPEKRFELIRKELLAQGKVWDNLDEFQKNIITNTLQINEEQAALQFGSEKVRKQIQAQKREALANNKVQEDWGRGLNNIKKNLMSMETRVRELMRAVASFIAKLVGFPNASKPITDFAKTFDEMMGHVAQNLNNLKPDTIVDLKDEFSMLLDALKRLPDLVNEILDALGMSREDKFEDALSEAGMQNYDKSANIQMFRALSKLKSGTSLSKEEADLISQRSDMLKEGSKYSEVLAGQGFDLDSIRQKAQVVDENVGISRGSTGNKIRELIKRGEEGQVKNMNFDVNGKRYTGEQIINIVLEVDGRKVAGTHVATSTKS